MGIFQGTHLQYSLMEVEVKGGQTLKWEDTSSESRHGYYKHDIT